MPNFDYYSSAEVPDAHVFYIIQILTVAEVNSEEFCPEVM